MKRITPMIVLTSAVLAVSGSAAFAHGGNGSSVGPKRPVHRQAHLCPYPRIGVRE